MKQIHPHSYWKLKPVKLNRLQRELVSNLVSRGAVSVGGAACALEVPVQEGVGWPQLPCHIPQTASDAHDRVKTSRHCPIQGESIPTSQG